MSDRLRSVEVHADWVGLEGTTKLGALFVQETRGFSKGLSTSG